MKQMMVDKEIEEKKGLKSKKIYFLYLDEREEIMKNTQFKIEDVFNDVLDKESISPERITKLN